MTGSLQERNGKYQVVLSYKSGNVWKTKWVSTKLPVKNNKKKAESMIEGIMEKYSYLETSSSLSGDVLFSDYMEMWLTDKKLEVKENTYTRYVCRVARIKKYFSGRSLKLKDLSPDDFIEFYKSEAADICYDSISKERSYINDALDKAVIRRAIKSNPAKAVKVPKINNEDEEEERVFLSSSEANKMLSFAKGTKLYGIIYLALFYGLRRGEILGLKWDAIDFENNTISISHTVTRTSDGKTIMRNGAKTENSKKVFCMLANTSQLLKGLKKEQERNFALYQEVDSQNYVFTWENGSLLKPDYITKAFKKLCKKCDFVPDNMRFHDLRHSCASILYDAGWDIKAIQEWLRHKDMTTTSNIYTHIQASRKKEIATSLENTIILEGLVENFQN